MNQTTRSLPARYASTCSCGCGRRYAEGTLITRGRRGWITVECSAPRRAVQTAGTPQAWGTATPRALEIIGRALSAREIPEPIMIKFAERYGQLGAAGELSGDKAVEILEWVQSFPRKEESPSADTAPKPAAKKAPTRRKPSASKTIKKEQPKTAPLSPALTDCSSCGFLHRRDADCL